MPLSPVASRRELFEQQSRASSNKLVAFCLSSVNDIKDAFCLVRSHPPPPTTPQPIGRSLATGLNEVGTEYLGLRNLDQTYGKDNGFRRGFVRKSTALGTSTGMFITKTGSNKSSLQLRIVSKKASTVYRGPTQLPIALEEPPPNPDSKKITGTSSVRGCPRQ